MPIYFTEEKQSIRKMKIRALASQLDTIDLQVKELKKSKLTLIEKMGFSNETYLRLRKDFNI